jgi:type III secretion protein Q
MTKIREPVTELSDAPALPRLQAGQHRALNRLYDDTAPIPVACAAVSGELHFVFFKQPPPGMEPWGWHRLKLGAHLGTLAIDGVGLAQLLGEPRADLLPDELRTVLLANALQPVVQTLENALRLRFEWAHGTAAYPFRQEGAIGFELRARDGNIALRGLVSLDDPAALDAVLPAFARRRPALPGLFDKLRVPLRFELGSAQISLHELRQIAAGDVIGIERWGSSGSALNVTAMAGGPNGVRLVGLADDSHITLESIGETSMNRADLNDSSITLVDDPAGLPLDRLDALEVVLRFEVGELSVSLGELKSLRPGHVFDLEQALNRSSVRILAHGNVLGKGSLVAVGDRLGVRVSDFAVGAL